MLNNCGMLGCFVRIGPREEAIGGLVMRGRRCADLTCGGG